MAAVTARVTLRVSAAEREDVVRQILAIAARQPELTERPAAVLRRALASARLAVAVDGTEVRGWFLSEKSGRGVHELGFLWVHPGERDGVLFERMLQLLVALEPLAVAVTFRQGFAGWLVRSHGFRLSSFGEVARVTRGAFVWRRLNPRRLAAAAGHSADGAPIYLLRERAGA